MISPLPQAETLPTAAALQGDPGKVSPELFGQILASLVGATASMPDLPPILPSAESNSDSAPDSNPENLPAMAALASATVQADVALPFAPIPKASESDATGNPDVFAPAAKVPQPASDLQGTERMKRLDVWVDPNLRPDLWKAGCPVDLEFQVPVREPHPSERTQATPVEAKYMVVAPMADPLLKPQIHIAGAPQVRTPAESDALPAAPTDITPNSSRILPSEKIAAMEQAAPSLKLRDLRPSPNRKMAPLFRGVTESEPNLVQRQTPLPSNTGTEHPERTAAASPSPSDFETNPVPRIVPTLPTMTAVSGAENTLLDLAPRESESGSVPSVQFVLKEWNPDAPVRSIRIALEPRELGGLRISLVHRAGQVHASIVVDRPEAMHLVETQVQALQSALADRGVQFASYSVSLAQAASSAGLPLGSPARPGSKDASKSESGESGDGENEEQEVRG